MKNNVPKNNFLAYLSILLAFFVLLFFTRGIFEQIQINGDENEQANIELGEKERRLTELNELQQKLELNESEILEEIQAFSGSFSDTKILDYIHSYAGSVNSGENRIIIRELSMSGDIQSDIGFRKAEIAVSAIVSSETTLFNFINYLTNQGEYRFYISKFSYPLGETTGNIQVDLPLTLYYK